jgi:hypothetical protein
MSLGAPPAAVPGGAEILQANSSDVDEHCASLGRWRLSYDQISAGAFRGSFAQLSLPKVDVFREITSQQVRQYGQLGAASFGIGLPWWSGGEVSCNGVSVADAKVITSFDAEIDMCTPKGFELRGVVIGAALRNWPRRSTSNCHARSGANCAWSRWPNRLSRNCVGCSPWCMMRSRAIRAHSLIRRPAAHCKTASSLR